jgi:hypothetical protein
MGGKMKKFRTMVAVGALACTFVLAIGIFPSSAFEVCWQTGPPDLEEILRLDFLPITSGNWLLNGFVENEAGEVLVILSGNGRIVGNVFIAHLSGSLNPTLSLFENLFSTWSGTLILDLSTGATTVEHIP